MIEKRDAGHSRVREFDWNVTVIQMNPAEGCTGSKSDNFIPTADAVVPIDLQIGVASLSEFQASDFAQMQLPPTSPLRPEPVVESTHASGWHVNAP
jgi:hypothetical protein